jgi:hypothetical protein
MSDKVTYAKKAPPKKERPRCKYCGKRLKPNYDTDYVMQRVPLTKEIAEKAREVEALYEARAISSYDVEWPTVKVPEHREGHGGGCHAVRGTSVKEDADGFYMELPTHDKIRTWRGTYGGYRDDTFCGLNCGYYWARTVNRTLGKKSYVCYDQENPPEE